MIQKRCVVSNILRYLELTRFDTPVKLTLYWHQFLSIKGVEFDGQLSIAEIAFIDRGYGRFGSVNLERVTCSF